MNINQDVLVSIVVPVYNAEKTIKRCVSSIQNQTYGKLEIILVDDGSEDTSLVKCTAFTENDSRIRVYRQENSGVSAARNKGIELAQGEYLLFVDSDDAIKQDMVEQMLGAAEDGYLVMCNMLVNATDEDSLDAVGSVVSKKISKEEFWELYKVYLINSPVNKLYSRACIKSHRFPEDISWGEDLLFNLDYLREINGFIHIDAKLYHYYDSGPGSLNHRYNSDGFEIQVKIFSALKNYCETQLNFTKEQYAEFWWKYYKALQRVVDSEYEHDGCKVNDKIRAIWSDDVYKEVFHNVKRNRSSYNSINKLDIWLAGHGLYVVNYGLRKALLKLRGK